MIDKLLRYVAPHYCYGCGETGSPLCEQCKTNIIEEKFPLCTFCFRPCSSGNTCSSCQKKDFPLSWTASERRGTIKESLDAYKFSGVRELSTVYGELLDAALPLFPDETVVTWIPTASDHVRVLGFDHMQLIARGVAKRRKMAARGLLMRLTNTTQHFSGSRKERIRQAETAFKAAEQMPKKILLLDDIMTTGATLEVATRLLKEAGAEEVYLGIITRQPLNT